MSEDEMRHLNNVRDEKIKIYSFEDDEMEMCPFDARARANISCPHRRNM